MRFECVFSEFVDPMDGKIMLRNVPVVPVSVSLNERSNRSKPENLVRSFIKFPCRLYGTLCKNGDTSAVSRFLSRRRDYIFTRGSTKISRGARPGNYASTAPSSFNLPARTQPRDRRVRVRRAFSTNSRANLCVQTDGNGPQKSITLASPTPTVNLVDRELHVFSREREKKMLQTSRFTVG